MIFKKCPNCDMENPETEVYCLECGTKLDQEKGPKPLYASPSAKPAESAPLPLDSAAPVTQSLTPGPPEAPSPGAAEPAVAAAAPSETPAPEPMSEIESQPKAEKVPTPEPAAEAPVSKPVSSAPAAAAKISVESSVLKKTARRLPAIPAGPLRTVLIAGGVIVLGGVIWFLSSRSRRPTEAAPAPEKTSILVLPFKGSGGAQDRGYYGEGLAEALIDGLNRLPGLRSPGAESSFSLGTKGGDSAQAGRTLGAGYVLTGTLEPDGSALRIMARLIRSSDGSQVWEGRFDRAPDDVFAGLQEVARGLVRALKLPVSPDRVNALLKVRVVTPEASDLYFQARSLASRGGRDNLEKAAALFQDAVAKDPGWAAAHAGLANACVNLGSESLWSPDKAFPAARQAVLKAMELEPGMAEARLALAILKWRSEWDFAGAEREFRQALSEAPAQTEIRRTFALFLCSRGRHEEAQAELKAARDVDPLSPRVSAALGLVLYYARQYDLAGAELTQANQSGPNDIEPCYGLGLLHIQTGDFPASVRMFEKAAALGGDPREMSLRVGVVLGRMGNRREVGKILGEAIQASRQTYVSSASLATVYASLMELDQAQACLEQAYAERDASLVFLKVSPLFDPLRSRPWFVELLNKIGL